MPTRRVSVFAVVFVCVISSLSILLAKQFAASFRTPRPQPVVIGEFSTFISPEDDRGPVRMVRFTLYSEGIFPQRLRVHQGLINLAIEDKTGVSSGLVIERIVDTDRVPIGTVRRFADHWRGRELIRFAPGEYRLYDGSRPVNQAELIVEP